MFSVVAVNVEPEVGPLETSCVSLDGCCVFVKPVHYRWNVTLHNLIFQLNQRLILLHLSSGAVFHLTILKKRKEKNYKSINWWDSYPHVNRYSASEVFSCVFHTLFRILFSSFCKLKGFCSCGSLKFEEDVSILSFCFRWLHRTAYISKVMYSGVNMSLYWLFSEAEKQILHTNIS